MKYGIIVCKETENIGDDIQSYAAACLLPEVNYYIEREHMDVFRPKEAEPVNTIMNGWLMNNKLGWPVSACINPLYLSMHFREEDAMLVADDFLKGLGGVDLKAHAPVGARDLSTQSLLERNGIPSYFSGCMTLTLPRKFQKETEEPYVCLTDIPEEAVTYVRKKYAGIKIYEMEHEPKKLPPLVNQEAQWKDRFAQVEALLERYQNATAVVTTRLHCALPCLALGTPVLLLKDDNLIELSRLDGLSELVRSSKTSDFVAGKVDFNLKSPPENPDTYLQIRNQLIQTVERFVKENDVCTPELKERFASYDRQWEERALWKDEILLNLDKKHNLQWNKTHEAFEQMAKEKRWMEEQYCAVMAENKKLQEALKDRFGPVGWLIGTSGSLARKIVKLLKKTMRYQ